MICCNAPEACKPVNMDVNISRYKILKELALTQLLDQHTHIETKRKKTPVSKGKVQRFGAATSNLMSSSV